MEKTKLHLPVALVAAAACFLGLYGGYVITGFLVGYVLLAEEDAWLKKVCARVLVLMLAFSVIFTVINLIPSLLELLYDFLRIFNVNIYLDFIHEIFNLLYNVVSLIKTVLFILMGVAALANKRISFPVIDPFLEKQLNK